MKVDLLVVETDLTVSYMSGIIAICRVLTNTGNHGKPGKLPPKKVPCMEKSWNSKKPE